MCGIAGFLGDFGVEVLSQMGQALANRGPDDHSQHHDQSQSLGLCHRRLSIIDLSPRARQPMWDSSGRLAIVFNGEIYNYQELREELLAEGYRFVSQSDTEVLLNLFLKDSRAMLRRLNGMFAFAIWDRQNSELFIARDAFGVKPLYYAETSRGFVFASALHSLLCESSVSRELNPTAVLDYLTLLYSPAPSTMLKGVLKLEPGFALTVRSGRIHQKWQWYELPVDEPQYRGSSAQASASVREALGTATRRQMVADVPVGAFLSGGLDSSSIVALARQQTSRPELDCFTIAFRDTAWHAEGMTDDLPYAESLAKRMDLRLHVIEAGPEILHGLEQMIFHLDEPQADPAALHVRAICSRARELGVKVLLSGTGGDDLFAGYRRHRALMNERYWAWLPMSMRRAMSSAGHQVGVGTPSMRRVSKALRYADRSPNERIAAYMNWIDPLSRNHLLSSQLRAQVTDQITRIPLLEAVNQLPATLSALQRMLFLEQKHFLADHNLNYTDKMSMAEGIEVRVPFLDPDVVALSWSLPDHMKYYRGQTKWVLKEAMAPLLPRDNIHRAKVGFGVPLRKWMHDDLRSLVLEHLSEQRVRKRGLFDVSGVRRLMSFDRVGRVDGAYTIFALLCIEIWCCLFIDGEWKKHVRWQPETAFS